MSHRIRNAGLIGTALFTLGACLVGASCTPKSTYELAIKKLDYQTAQHWKGVARNYNSEQAINELVFLPEQGRLVLAEDIKNYTADKNINDKERSNLADPDRDGIKSSVEATNNTNPLDPSNSAQKISPATFTFVRNLAKYRDSVSDVRALPQIYSGLERIIYVVESNPELTRDFTSLQNHIFANLVSGIPEISKYPKAMRQGTIQVTSQNLADEYAMEKFVVPAIAYIVKLQDEGKINALNGLGIPDKALEEEGIKQVLLPIELREVNIRSGVRTTASLEIGIYNVTFDESLGKSPQEWLREIAVRDYNNKNLVVWEWIKEYPTEYGPRGPWSNSAKVYAKYLKSVDDLVLFIRDYPIYLASPQSGELIPKLTEQTSPYYAVLLGRGFGKAVFDVKAIYPVTLDPARPGIHSEPFILTSNTSDSWLLPYRFGFWPERQAFIDDYKEKPFNTPHAEVRRANGTYEIINFNLNLTQQKK